MCGVYVFVCDQGVVAEKGMGWISMFGEQVRNRHQSTQRCKAYGMQPIQ